MYENYNHAEPFMITPGSVEVSNCALESAKGDYQRTHQNISKLLNITEKSAQQPARTLHKKLPWIILAGALITILLIMSIIVPVVLIRSSAKKTTG